MAESEHGWTRRTGRSRRSAKPERQSSWSSATSALSAAAAVTSAAISRGAHAIAGTQSSVRVHATTAAAGGGLTKLTAEYEKLDEKLKLTKS
ncbi:hypothetical protein E2562_028338 [Oryza meyeriana var. granulata]|uniref:Uncharacterized protein n=1 Tax=Oryza meyeriana var. granulata TaxID=110450 RepID=A0A6G1FD16_9ORYZ|nr:hypothetical protein E2562_028338 [Oryza meyeriana var. granulata]